MTDPAFIGEDFMLGSETARALYHEVAAPLPIIDYHTHLPPGEIAADRRWADLAELWLAEDHYKWRAMRANGAAERVVTGGGTGREKFDAFAAALSAAVGNPLYHWVHLELRRYFGIDEPLSPATAGRVWEACNERLSGRDMSARGLLLRSGVEAVCTTDDPADSLEHHGVMVAVEDFPVRVLPTFRPDRALALEVPADWNAYMDRLGEAAGVAIVGLDDLLEALERRHAFFHAMGCRAADHGLDKIYADSFSHAEAGRIFERARTGAPLRLLELGQLKSLLLHELALLHHKRDWTQQYHIGPLRNVNSRIMASVGRDAGCDTIGDANYGHAMARFLDRLDRDGRLARTILYNLNPRDNAMVAAMAGNFPDDREPGKVQWGAPWWFNDHWRGIEAQIDTLAAVGLLGRYVGMTTDSRSFLSFVRHEYFRRILCDRLGAQVEAGLAPRDMDLLGNLARDVCHDNAARYFKFDSIQPNPERNAPPDATPEPTGS